MGTQVAVKFVTVTSVKKEGELMKIFQSRLEKDFEQFVKLLPALEPVEFVGLAKILSVPLVRQGELVNFDKEAFEKLKENESMQAVIAEAIIPMDEIFENIMDKYVALSKHRRKEINEILRNAKREKGSRE